ncbi:arginase family protein [Palaeococcus sp. (in: euryarchaeotes)]|uniref:arginase family protein n=1 Tax=Palaeococcus sp. (in: euryarchaeotes) TaxID=2820298 RepID=UPI000F179A42|nr:arginase family protein [Palaeococcus sp. (in: euryarchaeotes)]MCD6558526.1 arginase family protein [Palaeococcus sp. (in: euryarchaeotes)]RLF77945.1 MAG: arginase family protein [Thermococci archaeon]
MTTIVPFGEKPSKEGVLYVLNLLKKNNLLDNYIIVESNNVELLPSSLPLDNAYIIGEHLATYGILKKLRPRSVLSIDAHTDLMHDYLDHGSWLAFALEEKVINRAAVIGATLMIPSTPRTQLWDRRVKIFPALNRSRKTNRGWKGYVNLQVHGVERVIKEAKKYLGEEIYLTVDLDVLKPEYKISRFQHGELNAEELLEILNAIKENFRIIAFDIAEISDKIRRSRLGKKALIDVYRLLTEE